MVEVFIHTNIYTYIHIHIYLYTKKILYTYKYNTKRQPNTLLRTARMSEPNPCVSMVSTSSIITYEKTPIP